MNGDGEYEYEEIPLERVSTVVKELYTWNSEQTHNPCPAEPGYTLPLQTL